MDDIIEVQELKFYFTFKLEDSQANLISTQVIISPQRNQKEVHMFENGFYYAVNIEIFIRNYNKSDFN